MFAFRHTTILSLALAAAGGLAAAGCTQSTQSTSEPFQPVEGRARIVSIDPVLGRAVLEAGGKHLHAYWNTERVVPQRGDYILNGPLKQPTVNPAEPVVHEQNINAKPGDYIVYRGIMTGADELLLRGVSVVSR